MDRSMIAYLPPVLQKVRDFACLMEQYQGAFSELWRLAWETEDNLYLATAGEAGVARWERFLGVTPREEATLEERRQILFFRISQTTPYTWRAFLSFMTSLIGEKQGFAASISELRLEVRLFPRWRGMEGAVWELIRWVVPANVEVRLVLVFTSHRELGAMTHRQMGAYSHWQLRNEVRELESDKTF